MASLFETVLKETDWALETQGQAGEFPPGQNGPYGDLKTPVSNTAHWLFTMSWAFQKTGHEKYKSSADKAIEYLKSRSARPMEASFWIRKNPWKDFCNGLIGQAWVMESLVFASAVFDRQDCYQLAEEVFLLHPFDADRQIWYRLNVDGSMASPDPTFNHQLWFAAVAASLSQTPSAQETSRAFFKRIASRVKIYRDGVINHVSPVAQLSVSVKEPKKMIEGFVGHGYYRLSSRKLRKKSSGYHAFNLYAFALFYKMDPENPFWKTKKFKKMLDVTQTDRFLNEQLDNPYSYPYNPTGIEMACVTDCFFPDKRERVERWLQRQLQNTREQDGSIMTGNSPDPNTSAARIYEACRLSRDCELEI